MSKTSLSSEQRLRSFAQEVMRDWPEYDGIDGADLQDLAEKHGLLELHQVTEPCGQACHCAEYGEFPQACYRKTPLLMGEAS